MELEKFKKLWLSFPAYAKKMRKGGKESESDAAVLAAPSACQPTTQRQAMELEKFEKLWLSFPAYAEKMRKVGKESESDAAVLAAPSACQPTTQRQAMELEKFEKLWLLFPAYAEKMRKGGKESESEAAVNAFTSNFATPMSGADTIMAEATLDPVETLPDLEKLKTEENPDLLKCDDLGALRSDACVITAKERSGMQKMLQEAFLAVERGESSGMQKMLQEAFPADKMQNSIGAAKSFAAWGFGKVVEGATNVSDKVAVDFAQEAHKIAQKTDQAMQKGVQEVRSLPGKRPKVRDMVHSIEQQMQVSKITGAASTKARALGQDLQPGLERTAQAAEIAKERAGEFAEQMKPRIMEAHETAKKKICKAASKAAATAAWFQTKHHMLQESDMPLL